MQHLARDVARGIGEQEQNRADDVVRQCHAAERHEFAVFVGIDALWLSHEPWLVAEPFTPEAGELWSREDIDYWIDVMAHVIEEAYTTPEVVKTAPHNAPIHQLKGSDLEDPATWATTWRAYQRKHGKRLAAE